MPTSREEISALAQELAGLRIENKRLTAALHLAIPLQPAPTKDSFADKLEIYRLREEIKKVRIANASIDKALKLREQANKPHVPDVEPPPNPHIPNHDDKGNPKDPKPNKDQTPAPGEPMNPVIPNPT